eukprot:85250-Chlamydomonas_euryale.AAC.3
MRAPSPPPPLVDTLAQRQATAAGHETWRVRAWGLGVFCLHLVHSSGCACLDVGVVDPDVAHPRRIVLCCPMCRAPVTFASQELEPL